MKVNLCEILEQSWQNSYFNWILEMGLHVAIGDIREDSSRLKKSLLSKRYCLDSRLTVCLLLSALDRGQLLFAGHILT